MLWGCFYSSGVCTLRIIYVQGFIKQQFAFIYRRKDALNECVSSWKLSQSQTQNSYILRASGNCHNYQGSIKPETFTRHKVKLLLNYCYFLFFVPNVILPMIMMRRKTDWEKKMAYRCQWPPAHHSSICTDWTTTV